jgi:hypothetical protein
MSVDFVVEYQGGQRWSMKLASVEEAMYGWPEALAGHHVQMLTGVTPVAIEPQDVPKWIEEANLLLSKMASPARQSRYPGSSERLQSFIEHLGQLGQRQDWSAYIG